MNEFKPIKGATVLMVDGEYHIGFYQENEWVDLGRAALRMSSYHEGTGAYTMKWTLASPEDNQSD